MLFNGKRFADKGRNTQMFFDYMYLFTQVKVMGDCVQTYNSFRFIWQCIIKKQRRQLVELNVFLFYEQQWTSYTTSDTYCVAVYMPGISAHACYNMIDL